ncbi:MAG TPA: Mur ligase family protein [Candidatus Binatia bacterium]|nr:Mur ligase family protein [Candidatus Binatia bacterium]
MILHNLQEAEDALQPFIPSVAQVTGRDITLDRMWLMMEIIGQPQKKLKIIHIAGTSGKTSTAYYLAALLHSADLKVGLHVSPHIDRVTERFQINGQPISDELYCAELGEFLDIIHEHKLNPTYFELHIAFAYWFFLRQAVEYAVIETGMGGLHDGTNVARNPDKVCVITDIGLDHTKYLGTTIPEIAYQKAGIIHKSNLVYMYEQSPDVMEVVKKQCQDVKATLIIMTEASAHKLWSEFDPELAMYQRRNWLLAYFTFLGVQTRDHFSLPSTAKVTQTQHLQVPARMDIKKLGDKTLVMDGAHNQQKMETFVNSFQVKFPGKKAAILLSLKKDKDYKPVADALLPISSRVITTTFDTSQELPVVSMDSGILADYFSRSDVKNVITLPDHHEAYQALLKAEEDLLVITGSFYLLYQIRSQEHLV